MTAQPVVPPDERREALAVLARASVAELRDALAAVGAQDCAFELVRPAEVGMIMLRGRVGGTGDAFNLGEATLARCAVRQPGGPLGVGYTLGRDTVKAELIARLDALLQDADWLPRVRSEAIGPLAARQAQARAEQARATAASRVEFQTLVRGEA